MRFLFRKIKNRYKTRINESYHSPKGFIIDQLNSSFFVHSVNKTDNASDSHWSLPASYDWRTDPPISGQLSCESLVECLQFQACVFDFGNEFCKTDPFPGQRKILMGIYHL